MNGLAKMAFSQEKHSLDGLQVKPQLGCGIRILQRSHQSRGGQDWAVVSLNSRDSSNRSTL